MRRQDSERKPLLESEDRMTKSAVSKNSPTKSQKSSKENARTKRPVMPKKSSVDEFDHGAFGFLKTILYLSCVWIVVLTFTAGVIGLQSLRITDFPVYFGAGSFIGATPKLSLEPNPARLDFSNKLAFKFDPDRKSTYRPFMQRYKDVWAEYANKSQSPPCSSIEGQTDGKFTENSCALDLSEEEFGYQCRFYKHAYTTGMGFNRKTPCFMLRLTRMLGYFPELEQTNGTSSSISKVRSCPNATTTCCNKNRILFKCQATNNASVVLYPEDGISTCNFPYWNQENYQSPFVMLQLLNLQYDQEVKVNCSVNIKPEEDKDSPKVEFVVTMTKKKEEDEEDGEDD